MKNEIRLRREISSVIILLQLVLSGSKTTIPAATWYVQKVLEAFAKGIKFKVIIPHCISPKLIVHIATSETYMNPKYLSVYNFSYFCCLSERASEEGRSSAGYPGFTGYLPQSSLEFSGSGDQSFC